jgi:hypothetical protein
MLTKYGKIESIKNEEVILYGRTGYKV